MLFKNWHRRSHEPSVGHYHQRNILLENSFKKPVIRNIQENCFKKHVTYQLCNVFDKKKLSYMVFDKQLYPVLDNINYNHICQP